LCTEPDTSIVGIASPENRASEKNFTEGFED